MLLYALQIASGNAKHQEEIVSSSSIADTVLTEQGEEIAPEGSKVDRCGGEPSLADILLGEVYRHRNENKELNPDQSPQPAENKEYSQNREGEGVPTPGTVDEGREP